MAWGKVTLLTLFITSWGEVLETPRARCYETCCAEIDPCRYANSPSAVEVCIDTLPENCYVEVEESHLVNVCVTVGGLVISDAGLLGGSMRRDYYHPIEIWATRLSTSMFNDACLSFGMMKGRFHTNCAHSSVGIVANANILVYDQNSRMRLVTSPGEFQFRNNMGSLIFVPAGLTSNGTENEIVPMEECVFNQESKPKAHIHVWRTQRGRSRGLQGSGATPTIFVGALVGLTMLTLMQ